MTLCPDLRRRGRAIVVEATRLDALLVEALDAAGDPPLTDTEAARLLLRLDGLVYRVEALADGLAGEMPVAGARTVQDGPEGFLATSTP